jgi:hypothetical protein
MTTLRRGPWRVIVSAVTRSSPGLWPVLIVASVCRLGIYFAFPSVFDFVATGSIHGSSAYDRYASNLLSTGTYGLEPGVADAALPPVYSALLAGVYGLLGRSATMVAIVHTAFDLVSITLLATIGGALFRRRVVGVLAGLGVACYPYLVFQCLTVNDTALFILELHAFVWLLLRLRATAGKSRRSIVIAGVAGSVLGVGILTRPVLGLVAVAAMSWLVLRHPSRAILRGFAVLAITAMLPVGLWALRNVLVIGHPVLIATNGGPNFWQGNNAETVAFLRAGYDVQWISPGELAGLDSRDPTAGRHFTSAALRYLGSHPGRVPELVWIKLRTQWSLDVTPRRNPATTTEPVALTGSESGDLVAEHAVTAYSAPLFDRLGRTVHRVTWGAALVLAGIGLVARRRDWRELSLILAVEVAMTAFYVVFHPSTRYRLPGDPLLFLLSAAGALAAITAFVFTHRTPSSGQELAPRAGGGHVMDVHHDRLEQELEADQEG